MFTFLLKLMLFRYSLLLYGRDNVYFTIRIYAFELPDRLLGELLMASACFVYVCDVRNFDKRSLCMLLAGGRVDSGKGTPSPFQGRVTVRLPSSKFFIFLSYPQ